MTQRELLKNEILSHLAAKLSPFGFKLSKSNAEFVKKTDFGWNKYQIVFLLRDDGWEINPGVLVRFDNVEDIYSQSKVVLQK